MIYLDYAANTPVDERVLKKFCEVSRGFIANPNSPHPLGLEAGECLKDSIRRIAGALHAEEEEVILTSGASESNNLALKGAALQYRKFGKHIVSTYLEHSSINGPLSYLKSIGFEIDYVGITPDGLVDLDHLKSLLRDDTILVSIGAVDSEIGLCQNIGAIAALLSGMPHCLYHVDATQAVGKIPVTFDGVDLLSFAPHKFYGLNGCGVLLKRNGVLLEPQIHGGISTTPYRSGSPALALAASVAEALTLAAAELEPRLAQVKKLNRALREGLSAIPKVLINSTEHSVPYILNFSIPGIKTDRLQAELAEQGICIAARSACCAPNTVSRPVYALTGDRKRALSTLRVSLSHLTTEEEIGSFLNHFEETLKTYGSF